METLADIIARMEAEKAEKLQKLRADTAFCEPGQIVLSGSSLMEMLPVRKLLDGAGETITVYNRAIGGYTSGELLAVLDDLVLKLKPQRVFINIGTNDLNDPRISLDELFSIYDAILTRMESALPGVELYLLAYYPGNADAATELVRKVLRVRTNEKIAEANLRVEALAAKHGARFLNLNAPITDAEGRLRAEYTLEGMHLNESGYRALFPELLRALREAPWSAEQN